MSVKLFESEMLNASLTSVVSDDGEIYFKAKDIATALGYENPEMPSTDTFGVKTSPNGVPSRGP